MKLQLASPPSSTSLHHDAIMQHMSTLSQDQIRTTISLPTTLHQQLRLEALRQKTSIGQVIVDLIAAKQTKNVEHTLQLLQELTATSPIINSAQAIHDERHSH